MAITKEELSEFTPYYKTEILESTAKNGNKKFWQGFAAKSNSGACHIYSRSWRETMDGSLSTPLISTPKTVSAKNVGRANETSPHDQAISEIDSAADKKIQSGYAGKNTPTDRLVLPMLAHKYWDKEKHIDWNGDVFVQPKFNGIRMLFDGKKGWSRKGNPNIPEVIEHLLCDLPEGIILDGELMLPGNVSLQQTAAAVKKFRPDVSPTLIYNVYDIATPGACFADRTQAVAKLFYSEKWNLWDIKGMEVAFTRRIKSAEEIHMWHDQFLKEGYEGIMVRHGKQEYLFQHRSKHLLKLKTFYTDEYLIVDVLQGKGSSKGCAIFVCETSEGKTFKVDPKGTVKERQKMFDDRDNLIEKKYLTVSYRELTDDNIPFPAIGEAVRDYE